MDTVRPVHNINGFRSISFENISVLDSYFIHRCIIIKYRSSSIKGKIHQLIWSYGPFSTLKNGFRSITVENINVLDSYFIHGYIIIEYTSSSIKGKIDQLFLELRPFSTLKNSFRLIPINGMK